LKAQVEDLLKIRDEMVVKLMSFNGDDHSCDCGDEHTHSCDCGDEHTHSCDCGDEHTHNESNSSK